MGSHAEGSGGWDVDAGTFVFAAEGLRGGGGRDLNCSPHAPRAVIKASGQRWRYRIYRGWEVGTKVWGKARA